MSSIVITDPEILAFYAAHPTLDIVQVNLSFIRLMKPLLSKTLETSSDQLQSVIFDKFQTMWDKLDHATGELRASMTSQAKEQTEQFKQLLLSTTQEHITPLIRENTTTIIDKTTGLLQKPIEADLEKHFSTFQSSVQTSLAQTNQTVSNIITTNQQRLDQGLNQQDQKIHDSFRDLSVLMNQAKEMVTLSNSIIGKLTAKMSATAANSTVENTDEDQEEMKKLKSYFMNMGLIDNPVTKETSGSKYHKDLALEIHKTFGEFIAHNGGIMTLADVYCRLNRARAIAGLVSPEDLLMACKQLNKLNLTLKYNVYSDLNLHVLEITQENNRKLQEIIQLVRSNECLTAYKLSKMINCSLIVAKKYLLDGERIGALCRDDTNSGLQFYSNREFHRNRLLNSRIWSMQAGTNRN
jgi:ESCRT-II complex subunit VPS36